MGLVPVAIGTAAGLAAAAGLARLASSVLFAVSPTDPLTYGAIGAMLIAVSLAACALPARRAAALDPAVALRTE